MKFEIIQDPDQAIYVLRNAGKWLLKTGKNPSKWWRLENLNKEFLYKFVKPEELYVGLIDKNPAVAAVLQIEQNAQDWQAIDKSKNIPSLYIHWLAVHRNFAGTGLPAKMVSYANTFAKKRGISFLRADTNANITKLRRVYENLGFKCVNVLQESYRNTAFYQKEVN
ncbi:GNAT family N-acetyltransferase [Candidatus Beckwithbacteria bacterium]|nr:GNAT family N-acetyltransferase [Candidatus Beckwithbacteria bacterium]